MFECMSDWIERLMDGWIDLLMRTIQVDKHVADAHMTYIQPYLCEVMCKWQ